MDAWIGIQKAYSHASSFVVKMIRGVNDFDVLNDSLMQGFSREPHDETEADGSPETRL